MDVTKLLKDELVYELYIRGHSETGDASDLRKKLSKLFTENVQPITDIITSLNVQQELDICTGKYASLAERIDELSGGEVMEFRRLDARIGHLHSRLGRLIVPSELQERWRRQIDRVTFIMAELWEKKPSVTLPSFISLGNAATTKTEVSTPREYVIRDVKAYKWGLKFTGDSLGPSLCSFLEEVEERRIARGISQEELFRVAGDLFSGSALVWFRMNRHRCSDWDEAVTLLKQAFRDPDYDSILLNEIRRRTQGASESPAVFIAKIRALMGRLSTPMTEREQLSMIERNLRPEYVALLGLTHYDNINELEEILGKLSLGRVLATRFREPPSSGLLEPDLGYYGNQRRNTRDVAPLETNSSSDGVSDTEVNSIEQPTSSNKVKLCKAICWNCSLPGHRFRDCKESRRIFCNGCGEKGVKIYDCGQCRTRRASKAMKKGNGEAEGN